MGKMQDPIMIVDHHKLIFYNESLVRMLQITPKNYLEKMQLIINEKGESLNEVIFSYLNNLEAQNCILNSQKFFLHREESDLIKSEKTLFASLVVSSKIKGIKTVSIIFRDVGKEVQKEREEIEEEYKNMLFFSLSHELRTPLNIFQNFLNVSKEKKTSPNDCEVRKNAKGAWRYLRNKISDILDYSQILTGEFALHPITFSLKRFVSSLKKLTSSMLAEKKHKIKLDFSVDPKIPSKFTGDMDRIEQVVFNFLQNAIKYTSEGKISFQIKSLDDKRVELKVSDTGCGMPKEVVTNLFAVHSYTKLPKKLYNKESSGVIGLGLTVSKMICEYFGGKISVFFRNWQGLFLLLYRAFSYKQFIRRRLQLQLF
eukprot:TRINITY_DN31295_c0_g1_i1.p1 TRINITY_DN31295_c0_g1~~TRINITY_DN31295_c0_g1_i1.p1  ORF type:complete len:370 (-),score=53.69 TRINITY_DN31295_c0_g1_i1:453-1562(-)